MFILLGLVLILTAATLIYVRLPKFGGTPAGERLERMQKSPHYRDGKFHNLEFTPDLTEGYTIRGILYEQFFGHFPRRRPTDSIPSVKTDLRRLPADRDILVWFGHSSYFMQIAGKRFLVDPVFSGNASPLPGTNTSFKGSDIYSAADMPDIDYLLITHDHYDHLDYETVRALKDRVKMTVCGLGVGAHLERWGFSPSAITETDWYETVRMEAGIVVHSAPTRHFSGRNFMRNTTLWVSFIVETPSLKLYLGGDSGYGQHFAEIGTKYGPFDLAILDNGQYNVAWQAIHMLPGEVLLAAEDLKAKRLLPAHSSKFMLAQHPWDEPLRKITELNQQANIPLVCPQIGQPVDLGDDTQQFTAWWEGVE